MAHREKPYVRLSGMAAGLFMRRSLWLGRNHLLLVHNAGYSERYQWFPYANIRAITAHRTRSGLVWTVVFAAVWVFHGLLTFAFYRWSAGWSAVPVFFAVLTGIAGCCAGIHLAMGPTCRCRIHTAVQAADLPSLRRIRKVNRAIRRLMPRIDAAQGSLPEDFVARYTAPLEGAAAAPGVHLARPGGPPPPLPGSPVPAVPLPPDMAEQVSDISAREPAPAFPGAGIPPPVPGERHDG